MSTDNTTPMISLDAALRALSDAGELGGVAALLSATRPAVEPAPAPAPVTVTPPAPEGEPTVLTYDQLKVMSQDEIRTLRESHPQLYARSLAAMSSKPQAAA